MGIQERNNGGPRGRAHFKVALEAKLELSEFAFQFAGSGNSSRLLVASKATARGRGLRTPAAVAPQQSIGHGFASEWPSAGVWRAVDAVLAEWLSGESWTNPAADAVARIVMPWPVDSSAGSANTTSPELQCPACPTQQAIAPSRVAAAVPSGTNDTKNDNARQTASSARATTFAIETARVLFGLVRTFRK